MKYKQTIFQLLFITVFIVGCNSNPVGSSSSGWTRGVGVTDVNHFYGSGGNLFAGTYCALCSQAYIFISSDEGSTWNLDTTFHVYNHYNNGYVTDGQYLAAPMTFIRDGQYLLAGISVCFRGAIYRSSDNGITWSGAGITWPENDSDHSEDINCFCVLNGTVFAGTYHGVFASTDDGITWQAENTGLPIIYTGRPPNISDLTANHTTLFAVTEGSGVFRSTNDGSSWTTVDTVNYSFMGLTVVGTDIFAAAYNDAGKPSTGGVFISTNNGNSWQHADADLPDHGVGAICSSGTDLFVGTETGIFASTDLGSTWEAISDTSLFNGATTAVWANSNYLFANSAGSVWRYPVALL